MSRKTLIRMPQNSANVKKEESELGIEYIVSLQYEYEQGSLLKSKYWQQLNKGRCIPRKYYLFTVNLQFHLIFAEQKMLFSLYDLQMQQLFPHLRLCNARESVGPGPNLQNGESMGKKSVLLKCGMLQTPGQECLGAERLLWSPLKRSLKYYTSTALLVIKNPKYMKRQRQEGHDRPFCTLMLL